MPAPQGALLPPRDQVITGIVPRLARHPSELIQNPAISAFPVLMCSFPYFAGTSTKPLDTWFGEPKTTPPPSDLPCVKDRKHFAGIFRQTRGVKTYHARRAIVWPYDNPRADQA